MKEVIDQLRFFGKLGVSHVNVDLDSGAAPAPTPAAQSAVATLEEIRQEIGDCQRCKLCSGRTHIVFGVGNPKADLMFVGEAPGYDEDKEGIPFVGKAGKLLTRIIESMFEVKREEVYIANILKCRPPDNRDPEPDEVASCQNFLFQQIEAVDPKIVVTLGKYASQTLLETTTAISRLRGQFFKYRGRLLVPTFHPSYLLRNPSKKREVFYDMKAIRSRLEEMGGS